MYFVGLPAAYNRLSPAYIHLSTNEKQRFVMMLGLRQHIARYSAANMTLFNHASRCICKCIRIVWTGVFSFVETFIIGRYVFDVTTYKTFRQRWLLWRVGSWTPYRKGIVSLKSLSKNKTFRTRNRSSFFVLESNIGKVLTTLW